MSEIQDNKESHIDLQASLKGEFEQFLNELEKNNRVISSELEMMEEYNKYLELKHWAKTDTLKEMSSILWRPVRFDDFKNMKINATQTVEEKYRKIWLKTAEKKTKRSVYQSSFEHFERMIQVEGHPKLSFWQFARLQTDLPIYNKSDGKWKWRGKTYDELPEFDESVFDELLSAKDGALASVEAWLTNTWSKDGKKIRNRLTKQLDTDAWPTLWKICELAEKLWWAPVTWKEKQQISLKVRDNALKLIETQKSVEVLNIVKNHYDLSHKLRNYYSAQSWNCNVLLMEKYPYNDFANTEAWKKQIDNRIKLAQKRALERNSHAWSEKKFDLENYTEESDWHALEKIYYWWVKEQALQADEPEEATLAEAMVLMREWKTVELESMTVWLQNIIMSQLYEQKVQLMKSLELDKKREDLYQQQWLSAAEVKQARNAHILAFRSLLDTDSEVVRVRALDGNYYRFDIKKKFSFDPTNAKNATTPANLFSVEFISTPGKNDSSSEILRLLNAKDVLLDHDAVRLWDSKKNAPWVEMNLIASQEYILRDESWKERAQWIISMQEDWVDKRKRGEQWKRGEFKIIVTNPATWEVSYPFGRKAVVDPWFLLKKYLYEPVGDLSYRQTFALWAWGSHGFSEYVSSMEQAMLALSVQDKFTPSWEFAPDAQMESFLMNDPEHKSFLQVKIVWSKDIPKELLASTPAIEVHAWIHEGKIFINADYFANAHTLEKSDVEKFIDAEWYLDTRKVASWVNEIDNNESDPVKQAERQRRETVYLDFKRWTIHEKAHRVFDYYWLEDSADRDWTRTKEHDMNSHLEADGRAPIFVQTIEWVEVPVSNELLSRIVEVTILFGDDEIINTITKKQIDLLAHLLDYRVDDKGKKILSLPIVQNGKQVMHEVSLDHIETVIESKIPWFSFAKLEWLDRNLVIEELKKDPKQRSFDDLTEASALTYDTMLNTDIDFDEVQSNPNTLYLFESNEADEATMPSWRGHHVPYAHLANALPIVMWVDATTASAYLDTWNKTHMEGVLDWNMKAIKEWIKDKQEKWITYKVILPVEANGTSSLWVQHSMANDPNATEVMQMVRWKLAWVSGMLADPIAEKAKMAAEERRIQNEKDRKNAEWEQEWRDSENLATAARLQEDQKEFNEVFRGFWWDEAIAEPAVWVHIFLRDGISNWPGKKSDWLKMTIVSVTDTEVQLQVSGHTERSLGDSEGHPVFLSRDESGARRLRKAAKGKIARYRSLSWKSDFLSYIPDIDMPPQWETIDRDWQKEFSVDNKIQKWPISHIWVPSAWGASKSKVSNIYKVKWGSSWVTLQAELKDWLSDPRHMDYESFVQFCADKDLNPYTEEEVARRGYFETPEAEKVWIPKWHWFDKLVSIQSIMSAWKNILETFKSKFQQNTEMDIADLEMKMMNILPEGVDWWLLFYDDVRNDTEAKRDATTFKNIEKYKEMLARSDIGDGIHGKKASLIIEKEIFNQYSSRRYYRLKTAWYLLYALDSGHPYFRKLAPYHGEGRWVKSLLGHDYHDRYMTEKKQRMDELKSEWVPNDKVQDIIAKLELNFIKTHTTDHPLYGTRFGRKVEDAMDAWGKPEKIAWAKSWAEAKWDVDAIYDMVKNWGIWNMSPATYIWGLEWMEGQVEEPEDYKAFYKLIIMWVVSWFTKCFSKVYMDKFKWICRRRGIPIGMYITHPDSSARVTTILDYIARKSGSPTTLSKSISKRLWRPWKPEDLNADNFTHKWQYKEVMSGIEDWWEQNGETAIAAFNYNEDFLIEWLGDESATKKEKEAIEWYFWSGVVFNAMKDYKDTSGGKMPEWDNPFFDWVLNLAPGTFQSYMFSVPWWRFKNEQSQDMREKFEWSMNNFNTLMEGKTVKQKIPFMQFVMKKFKLYFAPKVWSKGIKMMKYYMMQWRDSSDPEWRGLNDSQRIDKLNEKMRRIARKYIYGDNSLKESFNKELKQVELVDNNKNNGFQNERISEQSLKDWTEAMLKAIADNIYTIPERNGRRWALISDAWWK